MKLATNFKDFPALTAIFKDFQGLEFLFSDSRTFKDFQGACKPCVMLSIPEKKTMIAIKLINL